MAYLYLLLAIIGELIGSSMLKAARRLLKTLPYYWYNYFFYRLPALLITCNEDHTFEYRLCTLVWYRYYSYYNNLDFDLERKN